MARLKAGVSVRPARESDNAGLLALARACPMEGSIALAYEREPDYFALNRLQGEPWFVAVAEDAASGVVGSAAVARREVFVDGRPTPALYAGDLRVDARLRGGTLVRDLHAELRRWGREQQVELWQASVMGGNRAARVLARNHAGMPIYMAAGLADAFVISPLAPGPVPGGYSVERASAAELGAVVELLNRCNRRRNFAPVWTQARLARWLQECPRMSPEHLYLAKQGRRLRGVLAAWDQGAVQRLRLVAPPRRLAAFRLGYNLLARARHAAPLPAPGGLLRPLYLAHLAVEDDEPAVLRALLARLLADCRRQGYHYLALGLAGGHRLRAALQGCLHTSFATTVYAIAEPGSGWEDHDFGLLPPHYEAAHI